MKKVSILIVFLILPIFISGCIDLAKTVDQPTLTPCPTPASVQSELMSPSQVPDNTTSPIPLPSSSPTPAPTQVPIKTASDTTTDAPTPTQTSAPIPTPTPIPVPKGTISGYIRSQYIEPVAGYNLKVIDAYDTFYPSMLNNIPVYYQTTTDGNGCFQLNDVAVGAYAIVVLKGETAVGASYNFDVVEGQTTAVDFIVSIPTDPSLTPRATPIPTGLVRGKVTLQNGDTVAGGIVRIVDTDHSSVIKETTTGDDGQFVCYKLPLGTYQVYAELNSSICRYSDTFTLTANDFRTIDLVL
jgi:Carboxypeptidase regulatory-like domain